MELAEFMRRYVVRFGELKPTEEAPADARLPRFERSRFVVLGRKSERKAQTDPCDIDGGINLAYVRCEPEKGFCSHAHPGWEIFVPMNGRWRIAIDGRADIDIEAWDAVVVPGGLFHSATNIGDEPAILLGLNPGSDTASFTIAPEIAREISAALGNELEA